MSHFHHLEDREKAETPEQSSHRFKVSSVLLAVFLLAYGGFMAVAVLRPDVLKQTTGVGNVAVAWGLGIIFLAFVVSLVYGLLTRKK